MGPRESPFEVAKELIASLLLFWPYPAQSTSVLLCGPSGNGKSHTVTTALAHAESHNCVGGCRRRVISVVPPLALSLARRHTNGGTTLRADIRRDIRTAMTDMTTSIPTVITTNDNHNHNNFNTSKDVGNRTTSEESEVAVAVVIDHAALLLAAIENTSDAPAAQCPDFLVDLYDIIRGRGLFDESERQEMRIACVLVIVLFSGHYEDIDPFAREKLFDAHVVLRTPNESERVGFFTTRHPPLPVSLVSAIAARSGGISYRGLVELHKYTVEELNALPQTEALLVRQDNMHGGEDKKCDEKGEYASSLTSAVSLRAIRRFASSPSPAALVHRESAGYVDVQETRWADIAGLTEVKQTLQELVIRPVRSREVYHRFGVRPSTGVLLYGPPGTGKTMLARAMATELSAAFVYLDLPRLIRAEVGESERCLREFFAIARERSPSVMFIDELQAAFGVRYSGSSSTHDARLVSQLLHLLDDAQEDEEHFTLFVGATNVVEMLDPALLRPGRLDTHVKVPLPDEVARRALVRRVVCGEWGEWFASDDTHRAREVLMESFVSVTMGMSGAELRNVMNVFALQLIRMASLDGGGEPALADLMVDKDSGELGAVPREAMDRAIGKMRLYVVNEAAGCGAD